MTTRPRGCGTFDTRYCPCAVCDAYRRGIEDGTGRGVADERARVVAFLKDKASEKRINDWYTRLCAAEEIQRGEHDKEGT